MLISQFRWLCDDPPIYFIPSLLQQKKFILSLIEVSELLIEVSELLMYVFSFFLRERENIIKKLL